ncbi:ParA family protein [Luteipulveratus sp. YIM 133132]|uniref:ParA family protein n=1 Tax=Luteipulveratus flavus TaxID=3031728 RepID=UPI0023AEC964|nr:ParA family protein [Luteipulveratus sp. YIM 133132]MDE9364003.1 ParA family protein [Luteipulveratus sp. YIM 133132]
MADVMRDLARVVTFANGKGGAGKTSTAVNCAGLAAAAGWKTLLVDLDPQGNVGHDLGYYWDGRTDHGQHLVDAIVGGRPLQPVIAGARDNLDVVSGGEVLDDLESVITGRAQRSKQFHTMLADVLAPVAGSYDLVVIDTPPTRPNLLQLALASTRWIVVPTRADRASIEGLRLLANQIVTARATNPHVEILGSVLFDVSIAATAVRRNASDDITTALDGAAPLFEAVIRHGESAAVEAREKGLLVYELAERVDSAEPYWKALKEGRKPTRLPGSAPALAEDYVLLCQEILTRIDRIESNEASA